MMFNRVAISVYLFEPNVNLQLLNFSAEEMHTRKIIHFFVGNFEPNFLCQSRSVFEAVACSTQVSKADLLL